MAGVLLAEAAILAHLKTIGIVLLVLHGIVVALLALRACQRNLDTLILCHFQHLPYVFYGSRVNRGRRIFRHFFATETAAHFRGQMFKL